MIAKLRIWLSGLMRAEHKGRPDPNQREKLRSQDGKREAQRLSGGDRAIVVACEPHGFTAIADKIHGHQMERIQGPERQPGTAPVLDATSGGSVRSFRS
jgi:hypothetical protein